VGYNTVADSTSLSSFTLAVVASQIYEIPRNSPEFRTYCSSWSSKVIDLDANRKRICNFLLAISSNFIRISYRFRDIDALVWRPLRYQRIYTPLESAFSGLQLCGRHYGSIFIRLAVVASQNREITRYSDKIWPYSSSRSSKVIDVGVNRKLICDFRLVINSNFGRICCRFRDIDA